MEGLTDEKLNEVKQKNDKIVEQLEQKAQHEILTEKEILDYSTAKRFSNSVEKIQQERTVPAVTTPQPSPAQKIPQEQLAEQVGQGLSEKDESNIKGIREIIKATYANDPAKLKEILEKLDKQAEAISRGEIKLSDQSFVTKEAPKFDYEQKQEQKTSNEIKR